MIFRIRPSKDTFISNTLLRAVPQTGSNYGYAESLEVFKIAGLSGALGPISGSQLSRAMIQFSTASLDSFMSSSPVISRFKTYRLQMQHETTGDGLPESFTLHVRPISGSWDEGRGMDTFEYLDKGYSNWWKRTSTDYWASRGGDFYESPFVKQVFDTGDENLDVDVTALFESWASGTIQNNGMSIALTSSIESDSFYEDFFKKSFYSRHSQWPERRPYVEIRWDDFIGDDRGRMTWNRTGSLFLHNVVDGQYTNLSIGNQALIVRIADASGTITSVTASQTSLVGIYSASFCLPTGTYSGSVFYDQWGSGSFSFMTGTFMLTSSLSQQVAQTQNYVVRVPNVRDIYDADEVVKFNVFTKKQGYRQNVVLTASVNSKPDIVEKCYYAIENESTRQRIVPFGTGSQQHTRLSYDAAGNYFIFPMANLHSGEVYRIVFLVDRAGQKQVIDGNAKFRVR